MAHFTEKRKDYRIPLESKIIYTDGNHSSTAFAVNISRGGLFITTMHPLTLDSDLRLLFLLPNQPKAQYIKARVAHIVYDRQRCEVECGMGLEFLAMDESQTANLNLHILNTKMAYLELRKILEMEKPNMMELGRHLKHFPFLTNDILFLRYRVERICTIFDSHHPGTVKTVPKDKVPPETPNPEPIPHKKSA